MDFGIISIVVYLLGWPITSFIAAVFILKAHQDAVKKGDRFHVLYDRSTTYAFAFLGIVAGMLWPLFLTAFILLRLANAYLKGTTK